MEDDRPPPRRVGYEKGAAIAGSGWFSRMLAVVVGAVIFVAAAMMSLVLLAVLFVVGTIVAGYLWWRIRALRKQAHAFGDDGRTIDMELVHKDTPEDDSTKR
jgi:membrane protein implicated in regulation of membrane protease activity